MRYRSDQPPNDPLATRACFQGAQAGFSLIELLLGLSVLTIAIGAVASTLISTTGLNMASEEIDRATAAAAGELEVLRATEFSEVFACFNAMAADDPAGPGSAPGSSFPVTGLTPWGGAAEVGALEFPGGGSELREDVVDRDLGMPRDLNGDGVIDSANHAGDYLILPVRVTVRWTGRSGPVERSLVYVMADV